MLLLFILFFPLLLGAGLLLSKPSKPFGIALAGSIIEAISIAYALGSAEPGTLQFSQAWLPEFGIKDRKSVV